MWKSFHIPSIPARVKVFLKKLSMFINIKRKILYTKLLYGCLSFQEMLR